MVHVGFCSFGTPILPDSLGHIRNDLKDRAQKNGLHSVFSTPSIKPLPPCDTDAAPYWGPPPWYAWMLYLLSRRDPGTKLTMINACCLNVYKSLVTCPSQARGSGDFSGWRLPNQTRVQFRETRSFLSCFQNAMLCGVSMIDIQSEGGCGTLPIS